MCWLLGHFVVISAFLWLVEARPGQDLENTLPFLSTVQEGALKNRSVARALPQRCMVVGCRAVFALATFSNRHLMW